MNSLKFHGLQSHFIPAQKPGNQVGKVMLVMHGLGDSIDGYRFLPQFLNLPSLSYLMVNAPDHYFTGYSWFNLENMEPGVIRSREILHKGLNQLDSQGVSAEQVIVFGFSQGGLMAMDLATTYDKKFAGVICVSGYVYGLNQYPEKFSPVAKKQKVLCTHGYQDPILPIETTAQQIRALQGMGMNIQWREYEKVHTIDDFDEARDLRNFVQQVL